MKKKHLPSYLNIQKSQNQESNLNSNSQTNNFSIQSSNNLNKETNCLPQFSTTMAIKYTEDKPNNKNDKDNDNNQFQSNYNKIPQNPQNQRFNNLQIEPIKPNIYNQLSKEESQLEINLAPTMNAFPKFKQNVENFSCKNPSNNLEFFIHSDQQNTFNQNLSFLNNKNDSNNANYLRQNEKIQMNQPSNSFKNTVEFENELKSIFKNSDYMIKSDFQMIAGNNSIENNSTSISDPFFKSMQIFSNLQSLQNSEMLKTYSLNISETAINLLNQFHSFRIIYDFQNLFHTIILTSLIRIIGSPIIDSNTKRKIIDQIIPNKLLDKNYFIEEGFQSVDMLFESLEKIIDVATLIYKKYFHDESDLFYLFKQLISVIHNILGVKIIIHFFDNEIPFIFSDSDLKNFKEILEIFIFPQRILIMPYPYLVNKIYPLNPNNVTCFDSTYSILDISLKQYIINDENSKHFYLKQELMNKTQCQICKIETGCINMKCNCTCLNLFCSQCIRKIINKNLKENQCCQNCHFSFSNFFSLFNLFKNDFDNKKPINLNFLTIKPLNKGNSKNREQNAIQKVNNNNIIGCKHSTTKGFYPIELNCCDRSKQTCAQCYFKKRRSFEKCFYCKQKIEDKLSKNLDLLWKIITNSGIRDKEKYLMDSPKLITCSKCQKEKICTSANCCQYFEEPTCFECLKTKKPDLFDDQNLHPKEIKCPICQKPFTNLKNLHIFEIIQKEAESKSDKHCQFCFRMIKDFDRLDFKCCSVIQKLCKNCYLREYKIIEKCPFCKKEIDKSTYQQLIEQYNILNGNEESIKDSEKQLEDSNFSKYIDKNIAQDDETNTDKATYSLDNEYKKKCSGCNSQIETKENIITFNCKHKHEIHRYCLINYIYEQITAGKLVDPQKKITCTVCIKNDVSAKAENTIKME